MEAAIDNADYDDVDDEITPAVDDADNADDQHVCQFADASDIDIISNDVACNGVLLCRVDSHARTLSPALAMLPEIILWQREPREQLRVLCTVAGSAAASRSVREILASQLPPPSAFFYLHARRTVDVRPTTHLGAYLDALLEMHEMQTVDRCRDADKRFALMHDRLFDLRTERGRRDDAAALSALVYCVLVQPTLEALVLTQLPRFVRMRLQHMFAGNTARAAALLGNEDASAGPFYSEVTSPHAPRSVCAECGRCGGTEMLSTADALGAEVDEILLAHRLSATTKSAAATRQRHLDAIEDARQRALAVSASGQEPRQFYLVRFRDALVLWHSNGGNGGVYVPPPPCVDGYTWVHALELPRCLAQRALDGFRAALRSVQHQCALSRGLYGFGSDLTRPAYFQPTTTEAAAAAAAAATTISDADAAQQHLEQHGRWPLRGLASVPELCSAVAAMRQRFSAHVHATLPTFLLHCMLMPVARAAADRLFAVQQHLVREHARAARIPDGVEASAETVWTHAVRTMPPCHAQLISRAFASDHTASRPQHPQNLERIRLAMFLFYAGWPLERAMAFWRHLFIASGACAAARHSLARFERQSEYARTLRSLYQRYRENVGATTSGGSGGSSSGGQERAPGPAGCTTLCRDGVCPMRSNNAAQKQQLAREFSYVPDIEDILGAAAGDAASETDVRQAQTRCTRFYRALHPGWPGDGYVIAHPVAYYERALAYDEAVARAAAAAEAALKQ